MKIYLKICLGMFLLTFFMFYSWFSSVIVILFYYLHPTFRPVYYSQFDKSGILTFDKFIQALMLPDLIFYTLFILIFSFLVKMLLEQSNDPVNNPLLSQRLEVGDFLQRKLNSHKSYVNDRVI